MKIGFGFAASIALMTALTSVNALAAKKASKALQWYVKTTVEVVNPSDGSVVKDERSGIFGQLSESQSGYDKHDIPVYANVSKARAALVFFHGDDWGDKAGQYLSDYRQSGANNDSWDFSVFSTLQPQQVTLRWSGLFELTGSTQNGVSRFSKRLDTQHKQLQKLHLINLQSGEVVDVFDPSGKGKNGDKWVSSYSFSMDGSERADFRWVLGTVEGRHLDALSNSASAENPGNSKGKSKGKNEDKNKKGSSAGSKEQSVTKDSPPAGDASS